MSVHDLFRKGFGELNDKTEQDLLKQLQEATDENTRKRLQNKIDDVRRAKEEESTGNTGESLADALEKRNQQVKDNEERKKAIKKQVPDGKGGLIDFDKVDR